MCCDCSLVVQRRWVVILLQTAPQPFLEASHVIQYRFYHEKLDFWTARHCLPTKPDLMWQLGMTTLCQSNFP